MRDLFIGAYVIFLYKSICCGYSFEFELPQHVETVQMSKKIPCRDSSDENPQHMLS